MLRLARALHLAHRALLTVTIVLLLAVVAGSVLLHIRGYRLLAVQTASMVPTFQPGDALVIVPTSHLHIGDIISYRSHNDRRVIITHRLIAVDHQTGRLTTAGDARHNPDPPIQPQQVVGRAVALAPKLGLVLDFLRQPIGLALVVYLPALAIIAGEARRLSRLYRRPHYRVVDFRT